MTKKELNKHKKVRKSILKLFIGNILKKGKRQIAQGIFFRAINYLKLRIKNKDPFKLVVLAVRRASPSVRLRNKRFGAVVHKLPYFLPSLKAKSYAIRWLIEGARVTNSKNLSKAISNQIVECLKKSGYAWKKKNELHKIAMSNRAYMRLR